MPLASDQSYYVNLKQSGFPYVSFPTEQLRSNLNSIAAFRKEYKEEYNDTRVSEYEDHAEPAMKSIMCD